MFRQIFHPPSRQYFIQGQSELGCSAWWNHFPATEQPECTQAAKFLLGGPILVAEAVTAACKYASKLLKACCASYTRRARSARFVTVAANNNPIVASAWAWEKYLVLLHG